MLCQACAAAIFIYCLFLGLFAFSLVFSKWNTCSLGLGSGDWLGLFRTFHSLVNENNILALCMCLALLSNKWETVGAAHPKCEHHHTLKSALKSTVSVSYQIQRARENILTAQCVCVFEINLICIQHMCDSRGLKRACKVVERRERCEGTYMYRFVTYIFIKIQ